MARETDVMLRAAIVLAAVLVVLLVVAWVGQRRLVYFPETSEAPPAAAVLEEGRDVRLRTSDGLSLGAWFVPAADPAHQATVLVAHGNAGDRTIRAQLARALSRHGLGVLLFDYRGYAGNAGSPSEEGLALDVRAARRFLVEEAGVRRGLLLYFGESLGAAVVTELATEHPPAGLVLRSPFVDLAAVGQVHYPFLPVRLLLRDDYPVVENLERVRAPVTVVYGTADTIVPPRQSRRVAQSAAGGSRIVAVNGADHNDAVLLDGDQVVDAVVTLAASLGG
ncbi:MAG: alpha/beta hydrolase [Nocardioidaceae bacterium]